MLVHIYVQLGLAYSILNSFKFFVVLGSTSFRNKNIAKGHEYLKTVYEPQTCNLLIELTDYYCLPSSLS